MPNFYLILNHSDPAVITDCVQSLTKVGFKTTVQGIGTSIGSILPPNVLSYKSKNKDMEYVDVMALAKSSIAYQTEKVGLIVIHSHRAHWHNLQREL